MSSKVKSSQVKLSQAKSNSRWKLLLQHLINNDQPPVAKKPMLRNIKEKNSKIRDDNVICSKILNVLNTLAHRLKEPQYQGLDLQPPKLY